MKRAIVVAMAACAASTIAAQQPTFRSSVDLVRIDVVVVDKNGMPIHGLTQEAFSLRDRGKPQAIATFQEVGREPRASGAEVPQMLPAVRPDVSSNQSAQADRLVVLVIDDLHIWKGRTDRAKEIARGVVNRLGPQSSMAVLFTSGDHSTNVSADRSRLLAAVDTLTARQSVRRPHPAIDSQRPPHIDPEMSGEAILKAVDASQQDKVQDFFDNMQQYKTLENAAKLVTSGDVRRRAFVLLSEGIGKDLSGIFGAMAPEGDAPQGGQEYASGNVAAFAASSMAAVPPFHAAAQIQMMDALRRANVATYAIDPRGKVKAGDLKLECFPPPPGMSDDPCSDGLTDWNSLVRQAQHGLQTTSIASGGFALTDTDDFTAGLQKIVDDLDHYYLLGFHPSERSGKSYRPIEVRMAGHPDWTLRYRRGYMPGGKPAQPKAVDPMIGLSAGILPDTDLALRLNAIAIPGTHDVARVVLALEVSAPVRELQSADGKIHDTLKYEVLLVDESKARVLSVGGLEGRVTLSPTRPGERPPESVTYQVTHMLDVKPGRFEFRVSAQSAKLAKGGSVYLDVDVPAFHAASMTLGTIAIGYAGGARVPVAPTVTSGSRGPSARGAAVNPSLPFAPTLDRVFTASDTLRVYVEGTARTSSGLKASLEVLNASGAGVSSDSPALTPGDPIRVAAEVPLKGLAPGPYTLRLTVADGTQKAIRESGFAIR